MHINLPDDLQVRIERRTSTGLSEVDVIRQALDSLDRTDQERDAILAGISAMREGRVQKFDEFDRQFRANQGLPPAE